jgi:hypothetical protein
MTATIKLLLQALIWAWFAVVPSTAPDNDNQSCPNYELALAIHGLPVDTFTYVAWRESRCDESQINSDDPNGGSFGLLQINAIHLRDIEVRPQLWRGVERCDVETTDDLLVAWKNICIAGFLHAHAGGEPWGVR